MRRRPIASMSFVLSLVLITANAARSDARAVVAKPPVTRSESCNRLSRQVDAAIEKQAKAVQVAEAKALQRKAERLCAARKQAQGIRTLANALKVLGVAPVDPSQ